MSLFHPPGASVGVQRYSDWRDSEFDTKAHTLDQFRDAGDAESPDVRVLCLKPPEELFLVYRYGYARLDIIFLKQSAPEMDETILSATHTDIFDFSGRRPALRPEIPEAMRQKRKFVAALSESISIHTVNEFDLEHVKVVTFLSCSDGLIEPLRE